ncbi:MAG: hypothetical protein ABH840_00740 [Nanoarchaeota archaeon]
MKLKKEKSGGNVKSILKNNLILYLALIFLFVIFICLYFYFNYSFSIIEKREIYTKVILSDHYGIDINGTALSFGMIVPGGSASKELTIGNDYERDVKVQFLVKGEIGEFVRISENNFILNKNKSRKIDFSVSVPSSAKYGVYEGKVIVVIRKA